MQDCPVNSDTPSKKSCAISESYRDPQTGRFLKGKHWRKHQEFREKEYLMTEYVEKGRSTGDIAKEWGITCEGILWWLKKHDIPRRNISAARKLKKWGLVGEANGMYGRTGDKNPRWVDGSSPERQSAYARSFWKDIARFVRKRDGHRCRRCGQPSSRTIRLHIHHIRPWAGNPDHRYDTDNLMALCKDCHIWVHSKKNTEHEFISLG